MKELLLIALGGAAGAVSRYGVTEWARSRLGEQFPYGTLAVNVVGSLLLGLLLGLSLRHVAGRMARAGLGTGFLGALTTFSTFSNETLLLAQQGKAGQAALNVGLSLALGLAAAMLGFWLSTQIATALGAE
ncbi:MAG: fluoride efflux transporter CrcB [Myxococcales bacterium]|nr:fluoride efflux transporter CrcB [Myxococcales bacterium]